MYCTIHSTPLSQNSWMKSEYHLMNCSVTSLGSVQRDNEVLKKHLAYTFILHFKHSYPTISQQFNWQLLEADFKFSYKGEITFFYHTEVVLIYLSNLIKHVTFFSLNLSFEGMQDTDCQRIKLARNEGIAFDSPVYLDGIKTQGEVIDSYTGRIPADTALQCSTPLPCFGWIKVPNIYSLQVTTAL